MRNTGVDGPIAGDVRSLLQRHFGSLDKPVLDPLDELILTILSQSTTDANRDRAWETLRAGFPEWGQVCSADLAEIQEAVRVAGLSAQKARTIKGALQRILVERGRLDLDHLRDMSDDEAMSYLTSFAGVGVKTAACVLCFSLRRPVLPVDTHVLRIGKRLGWVPANAPAGRAHDLINARVEPDDRFPLHVLLIALGRSSCTARTPDCDACPLTAVCPRRMLKIPDVGVATGGRS